MESHKRVRIYSLFGRFWHWMQAALIITLAVTGLEIHGSFRWLGFAQATRLHDGAAISLIVLIIFAIFWHFTTGEWRHYLPTEQRVTTMLRYYTGGIFRNEPHPYRKTEVSKLNPLQRVTYLAFKLLIIPVMVVSGILYMFHGQLGIADLSVIAPVHAVGAFVLVAFFVVHVYMTTTGESVFGHIRAMVTGWEEVDVEEARPEWQGAPAD